MSSASPAKRFGPWLVLALILAAFALRLYRLDSQDIWWDEARNIDVALRPLAEIASAPELDIHPPVYFYLLHGWLALTGPRSGVLPGASAFAARFLSLWFGVLLVPLMVALGRRVGGRWVGLGAALSAAFLPFLLGEAQETRMYTVTLVWLACAGLALLETRDRGSGAAVRRSLPWLLFAIFSALALLTHYAAVFALVALWAWTLVWALFGGVARSENATAEHPERRAIARSRPSTPLPSAQEARSDLRSRPHPSTAPGPQPRLRSGCLPSFLLVSVRDRWLCLRTVLLSGLLTALLCLPGLPVALRQIPSYRNPNLVVPSIPAYLVELARVYGLGEHLAPAAAQPWMWALAAWLVVGWVLAVATRGRGDARTRGCGDAGTRGHGDTGMRGRGDTGTRGHGDTQYAISRNIRVGRNPLFALAWALLPLVIYYAVIRSRATFATRYISFALPGWLLLVGGALRGWASLRRYTGALAATALVAILAPGLRGDLLDARFFREDTRGLVAWLAANTDPQRDLIVVDQRYPFGFYYPRWNNDFNGLPPAEPADRAPAQYLFVDINTVADRLTALASDGRSRVYWVRWFESDTDPRGAVPFLLQKFGMLLGEHSFRGYNVSWYAIAPAATFELAPALTDLDASFGGQVALTAAAFGGRGSGRTTGVAATRLPVAPADQAVWAAVRWVRLPDARQVLKATLVLEAADGAIVGRDDRPILNDRHLAPDQWAEADRPLAAYLLQPDPATPPGTYALKLAVYDPATLTQLPAGGSNVQGGFVTLGQMTLTRADTPAAVDQLALDVRYDASWQGVRLLGRGALPAEIGPGDRLAFDLCWQSEAAGLDDIGVRLTLAPVESGETFSYTVPPVAGYPTAQWAAGEVLCGRQRWPTDPTLPNGSYRLLLQLVGSAVPTQAAADVGAAPSIELGRIAVAGRPHIFEPPAQMAQRSGARFGTLATLLGYDIIAPAAPADPLMVTLYWRAEMSSAVPYAGSVQMLDAGGRLRAQRDQQPGGAAPTTGWIAGEVVRDVYEVTLPADLPAASYDVIVKLYDAASGVPLPVETPNGLAAGDFLRLAAVSTP